MATKAAKRMMHWNKSFHYFYYFLYTFKYFSSYCIAFYHFNLILFTNFQLIFFYFACEGPKKDEDPCGADFNP